LGIEVKIWLQEEERRRLSKERQPESEKLQRKKQLARRRPQSVERSEDKS